MGRQRVLLTLPCASSPVSSDLQSGLVLVLDLDDVGVAGLGARVARQLDLQRAWQRVESNL